MDALPFRSRPTWILLAAAGAVLAHGACSPAAPEGDGDGTTGNLSSGGAMGTGAIGNSGGAPGSGGVASGGTAGGMSGGVGGTTGSAGSGGSDGGSGGGDAASGGAAGSDLGPIVRSDSSYVLEFSEYFFEVDPQQASIIKTYSLDGTNVLMPLEQSDDFLKGGSQFWIAPQDDTWVWPPPSEMDSDPWTVMLSGDTFTTTSPAFDLAETGPNVVIKKTFSPNTIKGSVDMVVQIDNTGSTSASLSPWQITRVARSGTTFWPQGDDICGEGNGSIPTIPVTDGVYFWDDETLGIAFGLDDDKFSCDGSGGWIAHVSGTTLLVKTWSDVPSANQHSVDKEIQLYFGADYEEVEMRGALEDLAGGASSTPWKVSWYLRPAPTDLSEASLIAAVQALLN